MTVIHQLHLLNTRLTEVLVVGRHSKEMFTVVSGCEAFCSERYFSAFLEHCSGFTEAPEDESGFGAIGLLTLDEMEPHRERYIAENGHRISVGMLADSLANSLARRQRFLNLHKDPVALAPLES